MKTRKKARIVRKKKVRRTGDENPFELQSVVNRGGRPVVKINKHDVEKLSRLGCTDQDMAYWFECSIRTIARRRADNEWFVEAEERGRAQARNSLRQHQMRLALAGNVTMLVWLGKNLLGQSDRQQHFLSADLPEDSRPPVTPERVEEVVAILKDQRVIR